MSEEVKSAESTVPFYTPGAESIDITPEKNGGVLKEIKRAGSGEDGPLTGDKVSVHYVGNLLDGTKFDSSRDRGEYFDFDLGKGSVIKAWDLGVATMKKGELAILYCKPEYAYGENGSPPTIPPASTLVFEVELFHWKGEDVSEDKDGGVSKSTLKAGEGYLSPKEGATCTVNLVGSHEGTEFERRDVTFVVGEASEAGVVDGLELAVKKMKKGEKARVSVKSSYAYGAQGNKTLDIPSSADLLYEVTLSTFEKCKETWEMDGAEKLEQSEVSKEKGTKFFKEGKYKIALKYYKKIVETLKSEEDLKGDEAVKRTSLLLAAHLNEAACHLKLSENCEAIAAAQEALLLEPDNQKGLFRMASANMKMQNLKEAVDGFTQLLQLDANNKAAKNQRTICLQKIKQEHDKEKKTYSGMFAKFAEADSKKEKLEGKKEEKKDEEEKDEEEKDEEEKDEEEKDEEEKDEEEKDEEQKMEAEQLPTQQATTA